MKHMVFTRTNVAGFRPYMSKIDGEYIFLFMANDGLSQKRVILIEKAFKDDEMAFVTTDPEFFKKTYAIDATNAYEVGGRKQRRLFFLEGRAFYKTEVVDVEFDGRPCRRVQLTREEVKVLPA